MRSSQYNYSNCRMIVFKINEEETITDSFGQPLIDATYIGAKMGEERDLNIEIDEPLAPGDYFVFVEIDWNDLTVDLNFVLNYYGTAKVTFKKDEKDTYSKH